MSDSEFHTTSLMRSSYYFIISLIIFYAFYYSLTSPHHELTTTTHFQVDTTKNILSYNLIQTLYLPGNNFHKLELGLVSIHTVPTIYSIRRHGSYVDKSPLFIGPEHVTWMGWIDVVCNFSGEEYYHKKPMGEFSIHIEVNLHSRFKLGALMVPLRSTAECKVELPLSTSANGVYGGVFGPTKCG